VAGNQRRSFLHRTVHSGRNAADRASEPGSRRRYRYRRRSRPSGRPASAKAAPATIRCIPWSSQSTWRQLNRHRSDVKREIGLLIQFGLTPARIVKDCRELRPRPKDPAPLGDSIVSAARDHAPLVTKIAGPYPLAKQRRTYRPSIEVCCPRGSVRPAAGSYSIAAPVLRRSHRKVDSDKGISATAALWPAAISSGVASSFCIAIRSVESSLGLRDIEAGSGCIGYR